MKAEKVESEDIYFCLCCGSFKYAKDHSMVSDKYCMACEKIGKKRTVRVIRDEYSGQYCESCYKILVAQGDIVEISEEEQKRINKKRAENQRMLEHMMSVIRIE